MIKNSPDPVLDDTGLQVPTSSRIYDKWGEAAVAGFQAVPDLLFKHQATLKLATNDMVVLLNILLHWWYPDQKPFPRSMTIAKRMGVHVRTVQRSLQRMEDLDLLVRNKGADGSTFLDPSPLAQKLVALAERDTDYQIRSQRRKTA